MNLFTKNSGMTKCHFKEWKEQEKCTLKDVEKSKYYDRCMWLWWYDEETCTNPDAVKED